MTFLESYLAAAISQNASDIHMCEGAPVRARIDGDVSASDGPPPDMREIFEEIMAACTPEARARAEADFAALHDVSVSFGTQGGVRIRATFYRDENGMCAAMRIIPAEPRDAECLKIPPAAMEVCSANRGMFIVTGSTGSGKSTTLACMVDRINRERKGHIITLEDPIEYIMPSKSCIVNQREIGRHVQSFASGLKSMMREDPNVVVIGELRDTESMRAAIQLAETGHLVLTTLHTRSAPSSIDRLIGAFPPDDQQQVRLMLADNLIGVLAQALFPRREGGRVAAFELLLNNDAVKNNIREQKIYQVDNILQTASKQGMISMEDSIAALVRSGEVSYEAAVANAPSRTKLAAKFKSVFGI